MMEIAIERTETKAVIRPAGDLVAAMLPEARERLRELIKDGIRDVEFDLSKTRMIDSSGLGLLMATYNTLSAAGGSLQVSNVDPELRELFQSMRLNQHIKIVSD
jgi:anti-anti-sigma factor